MGCFLHVIPEITPPIIFEVNEKDTHKNVSYCLGKNVSQIEVIVVHENIYTKITNVE